MTVYFHYSARAQVWGAAPTGAGMAIRNAYMERLQEGAQLFDYGAAVGMRFLYVGKWYRARVKALGWWLYVDNVRYGAEHTRWHMRLKVQYLGHTTYEMPPPARMASNSPGWIQAGGNVDFDAGTPGYWKRRYVSKALHNRAMPGAAAIRLRDAFIANT